MAQLGSLHDFAHDLATELTEQYSIGHIKYTDLNTLRELLKEMGNIIEKFEY